MLKFPALRVQGRFRHPHLLISTSVTALIYQVYIQHPADSRHVASTQNKDLQMDGFCRRTKNCASHLSYPFAAGSLVT